MNDEETDTITPLINDGEFEQLALHTVCVLRQAKAMLLAIDELDQRRRADGLPGLRL